MYSDLGPPAKVEGFRSRVEDSPVWGSWCGATRVFCGWDFGCGSWETQGGRKASDSGGERVKPCKLEARVGSWIRALDRTLVP